MKKATLLLLATILLACKKDKKEEPSFPVTPYSEKVEVSSETRAFTKSGEVRLKGNFRNPFQIKND